jgi:hypothetical protein
MLRLLLVRPAALQAVPKVNLAYALSMPVVPLVGRSRLQATS